MVRAAAGTALVAALGTVAFPPIGLCFIALILVVSLALGARSGSLGRGLAELDQLIYEGERAVVSVSLLVMSGAVFLDVVWRTTHSLELEGRLILGSVTFVLSIIGGLTAHWPGSTLGKRLAAGVVAFIGLGIAALLIHSAPNGFGWSQRLALVLLLWVGMLGSSMASFEGRHIVVEAMKRVVPVRFSRTFEGTSAALTSLASLFIAVLGARYARSNFDDWSSSGGTAGVFESLPIPYFLATVPIPIAFLLMFVRFGRAALFGAKEVDLLTALGAADAKVDEGSGIGDAP